MSGLYKSAFISSVLVAASCAESESNKLATQAANNIDSKPFSSSVRLPSDLFSLETLRPANVSIEQQVQTDVVSLEVTDSPVSGQLLNSAAGFTTSLKVTIGCDGKQRVIHGSPAAPVVADCIAHNPADAND